MPGTADRYAAAVHGHNLRSDARTSASDADVLAAAGVASKRSPLGLALLRINAGDPHEAARLVEVLAGMLAGNRCRHCHGTGRRDPQIAVPHARRWLVRWLQAELEREAALAAPAVERALRA